MTTFDRGDVVLADLPFSNLSGMKRRPAVIVSASHPSVDLFLLPLTTQTDHLQPGEFLLDDWHAAGLVSRSVVKRGIFTLETGCITRRLGRLSPPDLAKLDHTLKGWLGL
jgi:mRNA interferase MazF